MTRRPRGPRGWGRLRLGTPMVIVMGCAVAGCGRGAPRESSGVPSNAPAIAVPQAVRGQLLDGAIGVLGRLEDFDEQSAYRQVFDRINQWSHSGLAWPAWTPDPLAGSVEERFRPMLGDAAIGRSTFDFPSDVLWLRDQRWIHDVARSAGRDAVEDLDVANRLFQWTVRSLASVADPPANPTEANPGSRWFGPGDVLLTGRASGPQRAWIFLELLRHAGLDGVLLATRDPETGETRPWIPALITGGEAYLFDTTYGVPIPTADGRGVATAKLASEDPAVLAAMDVTGRDYPVRMSALKHLAVLIAASPESLSRRMSLVESHLSGNASMRLAVEATALATRAVGSLPAGSASVERARLWTFPLETLAARGDGRAAAIQRAASQELATMQITMAARDEAFGGRSEVRPLFAGRLRDFRGDLDGDRGAKAAYLLARPSSARIRDLLQPVPDPQRGLVRGLYEQLKQDAAYFLGLVMLREKQFEAAVDYLGRMTLEAHPDGRWADAARPALADALVGLGRDEEARAMLEADESPQRFGSRLRSSRIGR